jgi:transcriptional regulator with XRE-family HTH domain
MNTIGERIAIARKSKGWTQAELGRKGKVNLSSTGISSIELGKSEAPDKIKALLDVFTEWRDWIANGQGNPPKGLVITLSKEPGQGFWKEEAYNSLKEENQRLWKLIEKISGAQPGSIANFPSAPIQAGAKVVKMIQPLKARVGA